MHVFVYIYVCRDTYAYNVRVRFTWQRRCSLAFTDASAVSAKHIDEVTKKKRKDRKGERCVSFIIKTVTSADFFSLGRSSRMNHEGDNLYELEEGDLMKIYAALEVLRVASTPIRGDLD